MQVVESLQFVPKYEHFFAGQNTDFVVVVVVVLFRCQNRFQNFFQSSLMPGHSKVKIFCFFKERGFVAVLANRGYTFLHPKIMKNIR